MPSSDDFYQQERQRQRQQDPLPVDSYTAAPSVEQHGAAGGSSSMQPRRNSMHIPHARLQERRPSMPSPSFTRLPTHNIPVSSGPLPETATTFTRITNTDDAASHTSLAANSAKSTDKATDPRRRPSRNSPSIQPAPVPVPPITASNSSYEPSERLERPRTFSRIASTASSPSPSDDADMTNVVNAPPSDDLAGALIQFADSTSDAGIYRFIKSQTREELDLALKEHQKARDSFKNYPPLLEQVEAKKKVAQQRHKNISKKLLHSSQARDSTAAELANVIHAQLAEARIQPVKTSNQESFETRLIQLESKESPLATQIIRAELETLSTETRDATQRLQADIQEIREGQKTTASDIDKLRDDHRKNARDLDKDVLSLSRQAKDIKKEVSNLREDDREAIRFLQDDIRELFRRDEVHKAAAARRDQDHQAELGKLRQENSDLWLELSNLRKQTATKPDIDVLRREVKIFRDERVSKSEHEHLRNLIHRLQELNTLNQPQDVGVPGEVLTTAEFSSTESVPVGTSTLSELKMALAQFDQIQKEVAALRENLEANSVNQTKPRDPFAESAIMQDYIKRYAKDMTDLNKKISQVEENQTASRSEFSEQLVEHKTQIEHRNQGSNGKVDELESKVSAQQAAIALIEQKLGNSASEFQSSTATSQAAPGDSRLEVELRSTTGTHAQKIDQLQMQVNHLTYMLQNVQSLQGGVSRVWAEATEQTVKELQRITALLTSEMARVQKLAASSEHSIKALTSRYNNLSTEQISRKMAHHLDHVSGAIQNEQKNMKLRLESVQHQQEEAVKTMSTIHATVSEHSTQIAAASAHRDEFEVKLKTKYYDVLEDRTQEARQEIDGKLEKTDGRLEQLQGMLGELGANHGASKANWKVLEDRVEDLERKSLLNSFQQAPKQKPSPPPEMIGRGRSDFHANSQRSRVERVEPSTTESSGSKRPASDIDDSTTARASSSQRKKTKFPI